jgi:hypothetical protein
LQRAIESDNDGMKLEDMLGFQNQCQSPQGFARWARMPGASNVVRSALIREKRQHLFTSTVLSSCIVAFCHLLIPLLASAAVLNPIFTASIHHEFNSTPDSFEPDPFFGLVRYVPASGVESRAIAEFDLTGISAATLTAADLQFTFEYNNSVAPTTRQFDLRPYSGNGVADLSDYQAPAQILGPYTLSPTNDPAFYSVSILSQVKTILNGGSNFVGARFEAIGSLNPPTIVYNVTMTIVPEPSSLIIAAIGLAIGLVFVVTKRRQTLRLQIPVRCVKFGSTIFEAK